MLVEARPGLFYTMVIVTLILGYTLILFPMPEKFQMLRPEFICLLVIYWVMSVPQHLSVSFGFICGMVQGVLEQSVWGAHAFALALVAYFCASTYKRIRNYSVWQQAIWIFVLLLVHQGLVSTFLSLQGYEFQISSLLLSSIVSCLSWPFLAVLMRKFRVSYRMV